MSEWVENCSVNGCCKSLAIVLRVISVDAIAVEWGLFGQVLHACVVILNEIARLVFGLITVDAQDIYPELGNDMIADSEYVTLLPSLCLSLPIDHPSSAYDHVASWLSSTGMGASVGNITRDLQSHKDIGQGSVFTLQTYYWVFTRASDFPAHLFVEHLWELTLSQSEAHTKETQQNKFHVFTVNITSCLETYNNVFEPHRLRLGQALNMSARRSPKRRSVSEETDLMRFGDIPLSISLLSILTIL